MAKNVLNDLAIKRAKWHAPKGKRQGDGPKPVSAPKGPRHRLLCDGGGLYLRVFENGTKYWVFRFNRVVRKPGQGRTGEMGFGSYPDVSLADARDLAEKSRKLLKNKEDPKDPLEERKNKKREGALNAAKAITFDECARRYIASKKSEWGNAKHAAQWESTIRDYVSPIFSDHPVSKIDTAMVLQVLNQPVEVRTEDSGLCKKPFWEARTETASRVQKRIEKILAWATPDFRSGDNPARWLGHLKEKLPKPSKIKRVQHFKALPIAEIPEFMTELRTQEGVAALALEFNILAAARSGETRFADWREIDLKERAWNIPAERMKSKVEHSVPLSPRMIEILKLRGPKSEGLVFSTRANGPALSDMTLTAVIRRMSREETTHGFRSTFRDWAGDRTNFPREVAEAALAHAIKDKAEAAYRRGTAFEKRRKLMEAWASYCAQPPAKGSVIGINAPREASIGVM